MNWIEQLFGIDPDLGSGSLELLVAGALVVAVVSVALSSMKRARRERA